MIREINPEGRTGERCSASQYVNKSRLRLGAHSHHFTGRNHARNHAPDSARRHRLCKMPNQSISEAECKRLAQVLEPKALPARISV